MNTNMSESEYAAQFFGFTPEMFYEQFCELVLDEISLVCQHSINELSDTEHGDALKNNALEIHKKWLDRSEKFLKEIQPVANAFFTIPTNVLLPGDEENAVQYTDEEIAKLEEEVKQLKLQYSDQIKSVHMLKTEIEILDKFQPLEGKVDEGLKRLKDFETTLGEMKELEEISLKLKNNFKLLNITDEDISYKMHESGFIVEK